MSQPIIELRSADLARACGGKKLDLRTLLAAVHLHCDRQVLDSDSDNKAIGWKACAAGDHLAHKAVAKISK